jgi:hypothetical protein
MMAGSLIMAAQTVVSRNIDPTQTAIVTIGTVHAGTAANVIPESATLELSIRSFDEAVRAKLEQRITELVTAHVLGYGGSVEIEYQRGYPVVVNSAAETEFARQVAEELVGPQRVVCPWGPTTGSEDFAYYLQHKPGCFLRLGNGEHCPMVHNAKYDFDDANLTVGAAYWTQLVGQFSRERRSDRPAQRATREQSCRRRRSARPFCDRRSRAVRDVDPGAGALGDGSGRRFRHAVAASCARDLASAREADRRGAVRAAHAAGRPRRDAHAGLGRARRAGGALRRVRRGVPALAADVRFTPVPPDVRSVAIPTR